MGRDKLQRQAWTDFVERGQNAQAAVDRLTRPTAIQFIVDCAPASQGSMRGISILAADGSPRTVFKSDNPRTHPYRRAVGYAALNARAAAGVHEIFAGHDVPVRVAVTFVLKRPKYAPASRSRPVCKPDLDKLTRATMDALTGVLYVDDCQVVDDEHHKIYGSPECVHIRVEIVEEG
ncbi:MAG TPA: RusA family crossover junction endodeoxyribonuclease [Terracidiphilus sp.]|jgi:crossover junction endodeoxyribonuclease RusA|nr:RusA family crossover junction endodeoxyribonuclease [Terracidiphilus sp.]